MWGFTCSSVSEEPACNAGDQGLIPGLGRSPGEGNGNPLQYSCLESPTNRGAWQAIVHGVARVGHDFMIKLPPPKSTLSKFPLMIKTFYALRNFSLFKDCKNNPMFSPRSFRLLSFTFRTTIHLELILMDDVGYNYRCIFDFVEVVIFCRTIC